MLKMANISYRLLANSSLFSMPAVPKIRTNFHGKPAGQVGIWNFFKTTISSEIINSIPILWSSCRRTLFLALKPFNGNLNIT